MSTDDRREEASPRPVAGVASEVLVKRARRGDGAALSELVVRVRDEVYQLSLRMLWHPDDAADAEPATFRKRLSRARARVREFMTVHCGLVEPSAACSCARRIRPAMQCGRVDPARLLFARRGATDRRWLPVLEAMGEMERLHEIAAIHQSQPQYGLPERVAQQIKCLLESVAVRVLLS